MHRCATDSGFERFQVVLTKLRSSSCVCPEALTVSPFDRIKISPLFTSSRTCASAALCVFFICDVSSSIFWLRLLFLPLLLLLSMLMLLLVLVLPFQYYTSSKGSSSRRLNVSENLHKKGEEKTKREREWKLCVYLLYLRRLSECKQLRHTHT